MSDAPEQKIDIPELKAEYDPKLNVRQRMRVIMQHIEYVRKTKQVDNKYWVIEFDRVVGIIRPWLVHMGITFEESLAEGRTVETGKLQGSKGIPITRYEGHFRCRFVNVDDPTDFVEQIMPAWGEDIGDKGPSKAITLAAKAAHVKGFSLETGDAEENNLYPSEDVTPRQRPQSKSGEPERQREDRTEPPETGSDEPRDEPRKEAPKDSGKPSTKAQHTFLRSKFKEFKTTEADWCKSNKVEAIEDVSYARAAEAIKTIQNRMNKK